jgi:hypothetical protein
MSAGKGSTLRKGANLPSYWENYDKIFSKTKKTITSPMKIIKTDGCTSHGWTFDGKDLQEISPEQQEQIFVFLCLRLNEQIKNGCRSLTDLVEVFLYDDFESDEYPCNQCGDYVSTTTWKI